MHKLRESHAQGEETIEFFKERLAELELALEDRDWNRLEMYQRTEFSRGALDDINYLARLYWLKNPLIRRAVLTQTQYVMGQGLEIRAEDPDVNKVVQNFLDDPKNKAELTDHQARMVKETELQLFSNIFFVFFVNKWTGKVRIRTIPMTEIKEIITDPDDSKTPLFYKRVYIRAATNLNGRQVKGEEIVEFYPDWKNKDTQGVVKLAGKSRIQTEAFIYHIAVNKLSDMKFGVSEIYAATDWAKAYKEFLEDWATITKAYSRFAWKLTTKGGKRVNQAVKTKLQTGFSSENSESNPPPATGSIFVGSENAKLDPMKVAGANVAASDGDKLIHMVCAATGIFYHYLVGDPSTGNLATASAMERPMELMFKDRQTFWKSVHKNILEFVIDQSILAPKGNLQGKEIQDDFGDTQIVLDGEKEKTVIVDFPDLLEKDVQARINAIISGATLDGKKWADTLPDKLVTKMILEILGESDIDEILEKMFPNDEIQPVDKAKRRQTPVSPFMNPNNPNDQGDGTGNGQTPDKAMMEAIKQLRETVRRLTEHIELELNRA